MIINIQKGHPDLHGFQFIKKILRPYHPDLKPHISHICIKDGIAASTDGSRLHTFKTEAQYENGLYCLTLCRSNLVQIVIDKKYSLLDYPKFEDIIDHKNFIRIGDDSYSLSKTNYGVAVHDINNCGVVCNPNFVLDIGGYFEIYITNDKTKLDSTPIIFVNGNLKAGIMPMRLH